MKKPKKGTGGKTGKAVRVAPNAYDKWERALKLMGKIVFPEEVNHSEHGRHSVSGPSTDDGTGKHSVSGSIRKYR